MNINYSDVTVHLGERVATGDRLRLERALKAERGVAQVRTNPRAGQLLVVDYDPHAISALGVLRSVQAQGFAARLVGM
jgi:hypothetical protein